MKHAEICPVCGGAGQVNGQRCHGCGGRGWVEVEGAIPLEWTIKEPAQWTTTATDVTIEEHAVRVNPDFEGHP